MGGLVQALCFELLVFELGGAFYYAEEFGNLLVSIFGGTIRRIFEVLRVDMGRFWRELGLGFGQVVWKRILRWVDGERWRVNDRECLEIEKILPKEKGERGGRRLKVVTYCYSESVRWNGWSHRSFTCSNRNRSWIALLVAHSLPLFGQPCILLVFTA